MIRDQVIEKCGDKRLKTELFKRQNLTLDILLKVAQAHEQATGFVNKLNVSGEKAVRETESVNFTRKGKPKEQTKQSREHKGHNARNKDGRNARERNWSQKLPMHEIEARNARQRDLSRNY